MPPSPHRDAGLSPQDRLRKLVDANQSITAALPVGSLLQQVVEAARDVVGARYAALRVFATEHVEGHFVHSGLDPRVVATLADRAAGSEPVAVTEVVRLSDLSTDGLVEQLPDGQSPVGPFLRIPLCSSGRVYGALYLADEVGSEPFTDEDEAFASALAATSAVAVDNARLQTEAGRRQRWQEASATVSRRLLDSSNHLLVLEEVAEVVLRLAEAQVVCVVMPVPDDPQLVEVQVARGQGEERLVGFRYPAAGSLAAAAMDPDDARVVNDAGHQLHRFPHLHDYLPLTAAMAFPLECAGRPWGSVVVCRTDDRSFTGLDLELARSFTEQATLGLELADAREAAQRLVVLEDRARIARDLHDHVVQRLFAAGLTLQGTAGLVADTRVRHRLAGTVTALDETIRSIRTSIFELQEAGLAGQEAVPVRKRVTRLVAELTPLLGFAPLVQLDGPLDTMVDDPLADDLEAVLRESLTNAAKHSGATSVRLVLSVDGRRLHASVVDNGRGLGASQRRSGLANLQARAGRRGGEYRMDPTAGGGLTIHWTVPLDPTG